MGDRDDESGYTDEPQLFDEEGDAMAFGIGLGHGFTKIDPRPSNHKSTERNPYYYYPGFILGYLIKSGVVILGLVAGVGTM